MNRVINLSLALCRWAVGAVFVFSGFVKLIDPMGFAYKMIEYFEAFGVQFLIPFALLFAIVLAVAEFSMGLCLIMNVCIETASWAVALFVAFFTLLTLVSALTNPVSDCGCFGDAIKLTNWQTFFKNLILLPLSLLIFSRRKKMSRYAQPLGEWVWAAALFGGGVMLSLYCARHVPLLDFLPFHVGQDIPAAMTPPEGAPADKYRVTLVYQKDGKEQAFTPDSSPWQDSAWQYVRTNSELISRGYLPPIHDFDLLHPSLGSITDSILECPCAVLAVFQKVEDSKFKQLDTLRKFLRAAEAGGCAVAGVTASAQDAASAFAAKHRLGFEFCNTDYTTLKTTRLTTGVLLLHRGIIAGKWSWQDLPSSKIFEQPLPAASIAASHKRYERAVCFAALALALLCCSVWRNMRGRRKVY